MTLKERIFFVLCLSFLLYCCRSLWQTPMDVDPIALPAMAGVVFGVGGWVALEILHRGKR